MNNIANTSKKLLPMEYPPITSWTWHANLLSVLSNYDCTKGWIYSNYIQLFCYYQGEDLFLDFMPRFTAFTDCPWIYNQFIKRSTISKLYNGNIVNFLIDQLLEGNYIYGIFDEFPFLDRFFNNKLNKLLHELFIYGFDCETQTFDVADFTFKGKYSFEKVTFEQITKAYNNVSQKDDYFYEDRGGLLLASFNSKASYELDTEFIKQTIKEYLNSVNSTENLRMTSNPIRYANFGLSIYDKIAEHFQLLLEGKVRLDLRPLHVLYDHKNLMVNRIEYLISNHLLSEINEIDIGYSSIRDISINLRNCFIKAELKRDKQIIEKVIVDIKDLKDKEKALLEELHKYIIYKDLSYQNAHKRPDQI